MKNNIGQIIQNRELNPSDSTLKSLGLSRTKYTRLINNSAQPTTQESLAIAKWLNVPMEDLFEAPTSVAARHQLVKA